MKYIFDIKVSPYTGTAEILLNGQIISSQSQLRVCAIDHFSKWYSMLPGLLYSEVNDEYALKIQCIEIEYIMLTVVFAPCKECTDISYSALICKYDSKTRCQWLSEAATRMNVTLQKIPSFSIITTKDATIYKPSILNAINPFIGNKCTEQKEQVNIILATINSYSEGKNMALSNDDIIFVIDPTCKNMAVEIGNCLAIKTTENKAISLIEQWIDITILYPYMMFYYSKLISNGKMASFYVNSRIRMLTREEPIVESKMSAKLECGHSEKILLDEFPPTKLTVKSTDPSVVSVQSDTITALKTGSAQLDIISESGTTLCKHLISVYFVPRVTGIALSIANGNSVLQGSHFDVKAIYTPSNAINIANAKWTYTPANALRIIGPGKFEAINSGACTITVQVDNVKQSLVVQVIPLPKRIKMVPEIKMKVNALPTPFHATLEPAGSGCQSMKVRVIDTSIAQWNKNTKSIVAINEGDTTLEVSALDANGNTILRQNCKVTILPEKDIITPPTYPTIIIVCAIIALITASTAMCPLAALCGGIISGIEVVQNLRPIVKKSGTAQNKIELGIGIAGILGCIITILWYTGLI